MLLSPFIVGILVVVALCDEDVVGRDPHWVELLCCSLLLLCDVCPEGRRRWVLMQCERRAGCLFI